MIDCCVINSYSYFQTWPHRRDETMTTTTPSAGSENNDLLTEPFTHIATLKAVLQSEFLKCSSSGATVEAKISHEAATAVIPRALVSLKRASRLLQERTNVEKDAMKALQREADVDFWVLKGALNEKEQLLRELDHLLSTKEYDRIQFDEVGNRKEGDEDDEGDEIEDAAKDDGNEKADEDAKRSDVHREMSRKLKRARTELNRRDRIQSQLASLASQKDALRNENNEKSSKVDSLPGLLKEIEKSAEPVKRMLGNETEMEV